MVLWQASFEREASREQFRAVPKLGIIELIGFNNSIFSGKTAFSEKIIENQSAKQITEIFEFEHYRCQLLITIFVGQWSSGMILA